MILPVTDIEDSVKHSFLCPDSSSDENVELEDIYPLCCKATTKSSNSCIIILNEFKILAQSAARMHFSWSSKPTPAYAAHKIGLNNMQQYGVSSPF